jgi:serine phosphatase RsbU (regulator of sigma subunit)
MKHILYKILLLSIILITQSTFSEGLVKYDKQDSIKKDATGFIIDSLNTFARKEWKVERYESSISILLDVLQRNQAIENNIAIIKTCNKLGFIYLHLSDYSHSYSYFNNALEITKQKKLRRNTLFIQLNLAFVTLQQDDPERSLFYLNEILSNVFSTGDSSLIKRTYGITALYYEKTKELDKALNYYRSFEAISYTIMDKHRASIWRNNLKDIILDTETNLLDDRIKFALHNLQLKEKDERIIQVQRVKNILVSGIVVNAIVLIVLIYLLIDRIRDNKVLNQKNKEIEQQKEELLAQKDKLSNQNKNITSSINYALTIQNASLPDYQTISKYLDIDIFYRPKDIVSGDFYWFYELNEHTYFVAVVDSTGHGVPGAFMSLIGIQLLNEIVIEKGIHEPADILNFLNKNLSKALKQNTSENDDGMDVCLCRIEKQTEKTKIVFAGAKRPLFHYSVDTNLFETINGNSNSTGGRYAKKENVEYLQTELDVKKGDLIVLSSDGLIDQPLVNNKKYGSLRMLETLKTNASLNAKSQIKQLITDFESSLYDETQRDDISVMVIKF